ncbi:redoxin domain-containing protein [bacterium]|nr:redoxin domain-containing protein [bacterium]
MNAPDFPAGAQWLNVDAPVSIRDLRGKIVLLDFWTYCCINCMHVIPDLRRLEEEYPEELVVIGVHSAKFDNEQQSGNIRSAILRYEIGHPVVNDADMRIWSSYTVRSWPTIVMIDPQGRIITTRSGEGVYDYFQPLLKQAVEQFDKQGLLDREKKIPLHLEKDKAPAGLLSFPGKLELDPSGTRLAVSDSGHNRIVLLGLDGEVLEVIGSGEYGFKDGSFEAARFKHPQGVCFDPSAGRLFVADTENHSIRVLDLESRTVSTLSGNGKQASTYPPRPGTGQNVSLSSPWDLLLEGQLLYVAMAGSHQLWTIDSSGGAAKPFAGSGREDIEDGSGKDAALAQPSGISSSGPSSRGGVLYFADSETSAARRVDFKGSEVRTLIGEGLFEFGDIDGKYPRARLQHPVGIHFFDGRVYIADTYNHKIRVYDPASGVLSTLVGTGSPGMTDGPAARAELNEPCDIAGMGRRLFIADTNNGLIRVFDLDSAELSTLKLSGTDKLLQMAGGSALPGAVPEPQRVLELPRLKLSPATKEIRLLVDLPAGTHLNELAPSQLAATSKPAGAVHFAASELLAPGGKESAPETLAQGQFRLELSFDSALASSLTLILDCYVFYCDLETGGQCFFDSTRLLVPVELAADGESSPVLSYSVAGP